MYDPTNAIYRNLVRVAELMGIIFQVQDDYKNLTSEEYMKNKGYCEDLTEGKFSLAIIHSMKANPDNKLLLNILRAKTDDLAIKFQALRYMESTGTFEYYKRMISSLIEEARVLVRDIGIPEGMTKGILDILELLRF